MDNSGDSNASTLVVSTGVMIAVSLLFMLLRFGSKARYGKEFYIDDYILALAWVCLTVYGGIIISGVRYGLGRHISTLSHEDVVVAHMRLGTADFFCIVGIGVAKSSFAVTLIRLVQAVWQKAVLWFILVTVNVTLWLSAIFIFTSCTPIGKVWDNTVPGTCLDAHMLLTYNIVASYWSAAADFILALFPWFLLWGLNMRTIEKIGVCIAMSFGILSGITAVLKTSYIAQSVKWKDWTYLSTDVLSWAAAEIAVVIIAASIPFLRLALKEAAGSTRGGSGSRGYRLDPISGGRSGGGTKNEANRTKPRTITDETGLKGLDDRSDRSILGETRTGAVKGGITMTHQTEVTVGSRGGRDDLENQNWNRDHYAPWR